MFGEALSVVLGSFLADLLGRDPGPVGRMNKAYKASFDQACATGDWEDQVLMARLRQLTVPGAYAPRSQSLTEKAMEAWAQRLDPRTVKRLSRRWRVDDQ